MFIKENDEKGQLNNVKLKFNEFKLIEKTLKNSKQNFNTNEGYFENIFRFQIADESHHETNNTKSKPANTELSQLMCSMCKTNLLKPLDDLEDVAANKKYKVLRMPDNEIDELADNFFCHLLDHCSEHSEHACDKNNSSKESDIRNSLNPLRETLKTLRKSILDSITLFVMNENHLDLGKVKVNTETLKITCNKCSYNVGYKKKNRVNDYFIWKSNTQVDNSLAAMDLFLGLERGRYLLETKGKPSSYLYIYILSTDVRFKHQMFQMSKFTHDMGVHVNDLLSMKPVRKMMYKFEDNRKTRASNNNSVNTGFKEGELKELNNDFNVNNLEISNEHFEFLLGVLTESTEQLCQSLKRSDEFYFALI